MKRRLPRIFGLWDRLALSAHTPVVAWLAFIGWSSLAHGGLSIGHAVPEWLVFVWTFAVAIGSTVAVIGALGRFTRSESSGTALLFGGLCFLGVVGTVTLWGDWGSILMLDLQVLFFGLMCVVRLRTLSLARAAEQDATKIMALQARKRQERNNGPH